MKKSGFTLIELSIVLVVIGLLVGGVLVGQDLIKAAKQRQMVSTLTEFKTTWHTFRVKYNGIPGDFSGAAQVFTGNAANVGNADNKVTWSPATVSGSLTEARLVWYHLEAAGLYDRDEGPNPNYVQNPFHDGSREVFFVGANNVYANLYRGILATELLGNSLQAAYVQSFGGSQPIGNVIDPEALYRVDVKIDDGLPRSGRFQSGNGQVPEDASPTYGSCVNVSSGSWEYSMTTTTKECVYSYGLD